MLRELAIAELGDMPRLLKNITWIIEKADKLGTFRNIAAHTSLMFSALNADSLLADPFSTRTQTLRRFKEIKHEQFWRLLAGDYRALSVYASTISYGFFRPGVGGPLPRRPRLLAIPKIEEIDALIARLAQNQAPSRPRISLRRKRKF